tara:strand:+ start:180 stop:836 length:657 start_codon:yes stop_codon:yes gene_type:complete
MKTLIITIDGPAASGKGTIAKFIKKKFNFFHIDSGLLYRKIAKIILDKKINIKNSQEIIKLIKNTKKINLINNKSLRTSKVTKMSSEIAKIQKIRNLINVNQKRIVKQNKGKYRGIVIDGRDIGSVVFKDAKIKLYIDTDKKIRAKRRFKELIDKGERTIYSSVLKNIKLRDEKDKKRKNSPLTIPKGGIIIDNSCKLNQTKKTIQKIINQKLINRIK